MGLRSIADLAISHSSTAAPTHGPVVLVSKNSIMLDGDDASQIPLPPADRWDQGVDVTYKRSGANDLFLVPLGAALERAGKGTDSSLILAVDRTVPYRVVTEVLFTAGQSGFRVFSLLVRDGGRLGVLVTRPPAMGKNSPPPAQASLHLAVLLLRDGISVKASGGSLGPGCSAPGAGVTLPQVGGARDVEGLQRCVTTLRASDPRHAGETEAILVGNPDVPFAEIILVMDTLRQSGFDDIRFAVAR